ncbi:hypothetical protein HUT16_04695 [Kitasatospora sp. NA04385]|uniref:hypothetical protein n=1 Tax=Kitasatospora sp. NA04385 TaxID=2742135 RepID=UPI00158FCB75|nr:hypothetical protein [Kitasatospora sp. NA04385]QKW18457.1 hypothetical protein HUT16_04695 [Kitasatospora sp. NA04385]
MSAGSRRGGPALYEAVLELSGASPGGLPPRSGFRGLHAAAGPLPRGETVQERREFAAGAERAVRAVFGSWCGDVGALVGGLERLVLPDGCHRLIGSGVAELPVADPAGALAAARRLVREGTSVPAVLTGIALLRRFGTSEDVPVLSVLGTAEVLHDSALAALDVLDRQAAAVLALTVHGRRPLVEPLLAALRSDDRRVRRKGLIALPPDVSALGPADARRVVEAFGPAGLLDAFPHDTCLVEVTGRLLLRLADSTSDPAELLACREAPGLYERVVGRAGQLTPGFDRYALLLSLALDLASGSAALLDRPPRWRAALLDGLDRVLAAPAWAAAVAAADRRPGAAARVGWIRRTGRRPFELPARAGRFRIEVVDPDPRSRGWMQARVLVDGLPLVPRLFPAGAVFGPEQLLDGGALRAGPEPHPVRLAEAPCTEGCCGALWVDVRRAEGPDGPVVVWDGFRPGRHARPLPGAGALRFDAAAYDAEVARAETSDPGRTRARAVALLLERELRSRPELLARWDARAGRIAPADDRPDTAEVVFWYVPGQSAGTPEQPEHPLTFRWSIPDDGRPAEVQAAAALRRLATEDPTSYARLVGGHRARAAQLGFSWPEP